MGSTPRSSAKPFKRSGLPRLELVFTRLIPVRRLAGWAYSRFADRALSRLPFMGTAITFIPFSFERDHAHDVNNILASNIFSRE